MLGAIAGDIIGSAFEGAPLKTIDFPLFSPDSRFSDDTVLTVAVAFAIMSDGDYVSALKIFGRTYPLAGYGGLFKAWLRSDSAQPYQSFGNGSAMRVSPVGFAFDTEMEVLREAKRCAAVTHDHPEGIKGAQAVALAIFLARQGADRQEIRAEIARRFGYDLNRSLAQIRPGYRLDVTCQGSVPEAIIAFLESRDFEDAVRLAVSLGGDSDTQACISGSIAHAFYGAVPDEILDEVSGRLPADLWQIVADFRRQYRI